MVGSGASGERPSRMLEWSHTSRPAYDQMLLSLRRGWRERTLRACSDRRCRDARLRSVSASCSRVFRRRRARGRSLPAAISAPHEDRPPCYGEPPACLGDAADADSYDGSIMPRLGDGGGLFAPTDGLVLSLFSSPLTRSGSFRALSFLPTSRCPPRELTSLNGSSPRNHGRVSAREDDGDRWT